MGLIEVEEIAACRRAPCQEKTVYPMHVFTNLKRSMPQAHIPDVVIVDPLSCARLMELLKPRVIFILCLTASLIVGSLYFC